MSYVCTGDGDANEPSRSHVLHGLCTLLPASAAPLRLPTCPALEVGASLDCLGHHALYCWPSNEPCSGLIPHPRQVENFRSRSLDEKEVPFTTCLPARAPRPGPNRLAVLLKCNLAKLWNARLIGRSARCPSAEPGHCAQLCGRKSASKSVSPSLAPRTDELEWALFQEFAWPHAACHRPPNACFTLHSDDGTPTVRNIVINGRTRDTYISPHSGAARFQEIQQAQQSA